MSSAFLYLGIVIMWLCVLVPMWLRRDRHSMDIDDLYHEAEETDGDTIADLPARAPDSADDLDSLDSHDSMDSGDDEVTMEFGAGTSHLQSGPSASSGHVRASGSPAPTGHPKAGDQAGATTAGDAGGFGDRPSATADAVPDDLPDDGLSPAECRRRARVVARRRRWLLWSVLLHLASVVTAAVGVAPWWSVAPSIVLLVSYLTVLRVAVLVDRERRAAAARENAEHERREREHRQAVELAAQLAEAEIIDFRRRAEPFDQYAERPRRAVGD